MQIGPYQLDNNLLLAPMAGVTDRLQRLATVPEAAEREALLAFLNLL